MGRSQRNVELVSDACGAGRSCLYDPSITSGPVARLAAALLVAAGITGVPQAQAARIVVVQAAETPRLERTLDALSERAALPVDVVRLPPGGDEALKAAWSRVERGSVVVALGPHASDMVMRLGLPGPVVHCLAGADALRAGAPAVPSEVPVDQQAAWVAKLVPTAKTVGLLFDPAINTRRVEAQAAALGLAGYRTMLQPVSSPAALPSALDNLAGRADLLLALPDGTVYTRESSRGLLLYSFRKRIPIAGPSDAWVRMGALYALDWDYAEVGATCAALAAREVQPKAVAVAPPAPRPRVFVNVKSAGHFGIGWSSDVLKLVDLRHE
jgi:putative ABC transport system substrate-binding protein